MVDVRRIEVTAIDEDQVESEALAEAAASYPHLLVTGVEEIEHKGGATYLATVATRPKKPSQHPKRRQPAMNDTKRQIGPRDDMDHLQWAAIDLGLLCPHCGGDGSVGSIKGKVAAALAGSNGSGHGHKLLVQLEDPPLSTIRRIAKLLDVDLDQAIKWIAQLRTAEKKANA